MGIGSPLPHFGWVLSVTVIVQFFYEQYVGEFSSKNMQGFVHFYCEKLIVARKREGGLIVPLGG